MLVVVMIKVCSVVFVLGKSVMAVMEVLVGVFVQVPEEPMGGHGHFVERKRRKRDTFFARGIGAFFCHPAKKTACNRVCARHDGWINSSSVCGKVHCREMLSREKMRVSVERQRVESVESDRGNNMEKSSFVVSIVGFFV